mgnify:CR=1 FL=1
MERTIRTSNILPCIVPMADITYSLRENMFHQEMQSRRLNILRPYYRRPLGDTSDLPSLPLIINIGGGAWKSSTPWMHTPESVYYANHGYVVASIDYSTINFDVFPAQIEDVKCAIRFLRKNAAKFGIDPDRIALMGDSAGAQLAALAGVTGGTGLFVKGDDQDISDKVSLVVDFYGPMDFQTALDAKDNPLRGIYLEYLGSGDEESARHNAAKASPLGYIGPDTPPFLILQGTSDTMVDPRQSSILYKELIKNNVEADLVWLEGADHADLHFVQVEILETILAFLDKHMKKKNRP